MKRVRVLLERLRGWRRPPTGPLTTSEKTAAEELQQETLVKDNERIEREQGIGLLLGWFETGCFRRNDCAGARVD